ncbi:phospholipid scramblase 1-like isoform X1 [Clupea harengus]|uniref:Phospholipid scramblase n=1 Tax=Clupea harengus TaxID=7950 RepID=A0A8M1K5A1_CLUHA|nr:phospholipid scramblase 1-like isoform X1 [Clupea harengus]
MCRVALEVQSPPGNPIGYVKQNWHPYIPKFTIQDEKRNSVLKIIGPFCDCKCFSDVNFEIKSLDETSVVGRISKQWSGYGNEMFTDADNFGVQFPMDMDVKMKATILGACFLIVSLYQFIITAEFITDQEENMFPFSREVT